MRKRAGKQSKVDADAADQWAGTATSHPAGTAPDTGEEKPWRAAHVRRDMTRAALVPLPEDYYLAMQWLREQRVIRSQRALIREAAIAEIDRLVEHATGTPVRTPDDKQQEE